MRIRRTSQLGLAKSLRKAEASRFRKFFAIRQTLGGHEDFEICAMLVVILCYRMRFLHPVHIAHLFDWPMAKAEHFFSQLIKRNYLKLDDISGIGIGMTIGGYGHYLASISDHARNRFMNACPYYMVGIRVRRTLSTKLPHDLAVLRLSLLTARLVDAVDMIPDYCSGIRYARGDKVPDAYLQTAHGEVVWVEIEYSKKTGADLKSFCERTISSIERGRADAVYVYLDKPCDAKLYRKFFDAACHGDSRTQLPQIRIMQSTIVSHVAAYGGEIPNIESLRVRNFRAGHTPHALRERFDKRRRLVQAAESGASAAFFVEH